jgi:hypothetical protein
MCKESVRDEISECIAREYMTRVEGFMVEHANIKSWLELTQAGANELDILSNYESHFGFDKQALDCSTLAKLNEVRTAFIEWGKPLGYLPWGAP